MLEFVKPKFICIKSTFVTVLHNLILTSDTAVPICKTQLTLHLTFPIFIIVNIKYAPFCKSIYFRLQVRRLRSNGYCAGPAVEVLLWSCVVLFLCLWMEFLLRNTYSFERISRDTWSLRMKTKFFKSYPFLLLGEFKHAVVILMCMNYNN
jgi:hypothetical protein